MYGKATQWRSLPRKSPLAAAKLDAFNRNRYRIETTGATTAGPSSIVTINLPDAAVLDLRTFRVHMDVLTTAAAGATGQVRAKCPHASDLIANMEVYMGRIFRDRLCLCGGFLRCELWIIDCFQMYCLSCWQQLQQSWCYSRHTATRSRFLSSI